MDTKVKTPIVTNDMIEYLEHMFKDKCPDITTSDRQVWFDAGSVHVVKHLKHLKIRQEANILNKDIL
jgi:hypothetical protein